MQCPNVLVYNEQDNFMSSHYKRSQSPIKQLGQKQVQNGQCPSCQQTGGFRLLEEDQSTQIIKISQHNIIKNLEIYGWRSKTYLPIIKPTHVSVYPLQSAAGQNPQFHFDTANTNHHLSQLNYNQSLLALKQFVEQSPQVATYELRVKTEPIKCRLKQVNDLPLPQLLHLLKEILIGFELLIDIFGYFLPTDQMVVVNAASQWKVWINQNYIKNERDEHPATQKQFLAHALQLAQKHSQGSNTCRHFLGQLKELIEQKEPSFLKVISKINEYISVNKVFQVNRVLLPLSRLSKPCVSQKSSVEFTAIRKLSSNSRASPSKRQQLNHFQPEFHNPYHNHLQKSHFNFTHKNQYNNQQPQNFNNNIPPALKPTSFQHLPTNFYPKNVQPFKSHKTINYPEVFSPKSIPNFSTFHTASRDWQQNLQFTPKNKNFTNVFSLAQSDKLIKPNIATFESPQINRFRQTKSPSPLKFQPPPLRCTSGNPQPSKLIQLIKPTPVVEQVSKPQRKYSDNLQKIKSTDALLKMHKKIAGSSIYQGDSMGKMELKRQLSSNDHEAYQVKIHNKNSSQVSPNNSSSTKQVKNSGEVKIDFIPGYLKMKQKDLGPNKAKNNMSFVNNNGKDERGKTIGPSDKNMTISHQFQSSKEVSLPQKQNRQSEDYHKAGNKNQWVNSISGLFSDNVSIKHLKESVKFKIQEEEPFEKQYLKDVKLDMLQKFGRKVNHMVLEQDEPKYPNQYKSMQLIEEETQQVKSYLESQRREDDDLKSRQIRSKHQTMHSKPLEDHQPSIHSHQYRSEFDDNDADSQIASARNNPSELESAEDTGFNFQTEMYVINPKREN